MIGINEFIIRRFCCMHSNCGKEYSTKLNLKRHLLTNHLKVKTFPCSVCSKVFSSKQSLKEHGYLHSGAKPYTCHLCLQNFRHISSLCVHLKYHKVGLIEEEVLVNELSISGQSEIYQL